LSLEILTKSLHKRNYLHLYSLTVFEDKKRAIPARDLESGQKFIKKNIERIPGVLRTNTTKVMKEVRLTSEEEWKTLVKDHLLSD